MGSTPISFVRFIKGTPMARYLDDLGPDDEGLAPLLRQP